MGRLFRITEEDLVVLEEMKEASIIALQIKAERQAIKRLEHEKAEIEYNELLKCLEPELLEQAVDSRSFYESTENAVEKLKKTFKVQINNQVVQDKIQEIYKQITEKNNYIAELCEIQKNIKEYLATREEQEHE